MVSSRSLGVSSESEGLGLRWAGMLKGLGFGV